MESQIHLSTVITRWWKGVFSNNSFINCDHIQLCAGSDEERSLPPADSKIENNIFYRDTPGKLFTVYDDISGIEFKNNYANDAVEIPVEINIENAEIKLVKNESGIWIPEPGTVENAGCTLESPVATKENTRIEGYDLAEVELIFDNGNINTVEPGLNSLADAVSISAPGDILRLNDGEYVNTKEIFIKHPLTIRANNKGKVTLVSEKKNMLTIENQGALKLGGVIISGSSSPDNSGNSIISTSKYSMNRNYKLIVEDCLIQDLDVNHSFDFLKVYKNTFADTIMFKNCEFKNISGNIAALNKETDDLGIYNAEYVIYENTSFEDIGGTILDLYRGGTDESTFGPILRFEKCEVKNSGYAKRNKSGSAMRLHGVQKANILESSFMNSADIKLHLTQNGDPITNLVNVNIFPEAGIVSNSKEFNIENLMHKDL
jgi:poly(beta-D-mannuronate) lyase